MVSSIKNVLIIATIVIRFRVILSAFGHITRPHILFFSFISFVIFAVSIEKCDFLYVLLNKNLTFSIFVMFKLVPNTKLDLV